MMAILRRIQREPAESMAERRVRRDRPRCPRRLRRHVMDFFLYFFKFFPVSGVINLTAWESVAGTRPTGNIASNQSTSELCCDMGFIGLFLFLFA